MARENIVLAAARRRLPEFSIGAGALLTPELAFGHERWVLHPEEAAQLAAEPKPALFTLGDPLGLAAFMIFVLAFVASVALDERASCEPPLFWRRLAGPAREWLPTLARWGAGYALIACALAMEPRVGNGGMGYATLLAPDLELALLGPSWGWLRWFELALGVALLLGLWPRAAALALIALNLLALSLFGEPMASYLLANLGVAFFLLAAPAGRMALWPGPFGNAPIIGFDRAIAVMRIAVGAQLFFLALYFKALQPMMIVGAIERSSLPFAQAWPEGIAYAMTLIEIAIAISLIVGSWTRLVGLVLLSGFVGLSFFFEETAMAHASLYGPAIAFALHGAGGFGVEEDAGARRAAGEAADRRARLARRHARLLAELDRISPDGAAAVIERAAAVRLAGEAMALASINEGVEDRLRALRGRR